ncbi:MAG: hypothetical protein R3266_09940, partial [Gemmatimonadota bacterium]|nr:hypothetical protein [Gemmatimonadota bacterium]
DPAAVEARRRAGRWLLEQEGRRVAWWIRFLTRFIPEPRRLALDPDLIGWPWVEGTFSWVEPTSYALMALKRLRPELPARETESRIEEAERLLFDRVCPGGGWNYGNSVVFGEALWPYPDTTALALLALADRRESPAVSEGIRTLDAMMATHDSVLALGLALRAFRTLGVASAALRVRLEDRLAARTGGETRGLAWAALALSDGEPVARSARA